MELTSSPNELRDGFARQAIELMRDLAQGEINNDNARAFLSPGHLHAAQLLLKQLQQGYPSKVGFRELSITWHMTYTDLQRFCAAIYKTI
jgi:hypothetical protein